mmetsp:Transcript_67529/g.170399  ORF Transcript_67529/g.170399 Transcript_67529/m.170399 type:complete len:202 (+) Transcript_67529:1066-1671(+)
MGAVRVAARGLLLRAVLRPPLREVCGVAAERVGSSPPRSASLAAAARHAAGGQLGVRGAPLQLGRVLGAGVPRYDGGRGDRVAGPRDIELATLLFLRHLRWPRRARVRFVRPPAPAHELCGGATRTGGLGQVRAGAPRHLRLPRAGLPRNGQAVPQLGAGHRGGQRGLRLRRRRRVHRRRLDLVREPWRQPRPGVPRRSSP